MRLILLFVGIIIGFSFRSVICSYKLSLMLNSFEEIKLMNTKLLMNQKEGSKRYYYIEGVLDGCQGIGEIILGKENIGKKIKSDVE